jgi:hypothetical protein
MAYAKLLKHDYYKYFSEHGNEGLRSDLEARKEKEKQSPLVSNDKVAQLAALKLHRPIL